VIPSAPRPVDAPISLSVVVCTMNRPDQVVECVRRILANLDMDIELVVVDQSEASASRRAIAAVGKTSG
jgi:GT2 family glycosyltransferase